MMKICSGGETGNFTKSRKFFENQIRLITTITQYSEGFVSKFDECIPINRRTKKKDIPESLNADQSKISFQSSTSCAAFALALVCRISRGISVSPRNPTIIKYPKKLIKPNIHVIIRLPLMSSSTLPLIAKFHGERSRSEDIRTFKFKQTTRPYINHLMFVMLLFTRR